MRWRGLVLAMIPACLAGCGKPAPAPAPPPVTPQPAPATTPAPTPEPSPTTPPPPPAPAPPKLDGVTLTPKDGVEILEPDGWEEEQADDGSLLRLRRIEPIGDTRVNVSLDYNVDEALPDGTTIESVRDEFLAKLPEQMAGEQWTTIGAETTAAAGYPALAIVGDLIDGGVEYRAKLLVILQDRTFWTLSVLGPREAFAAKVQPEFEAIAASLKLP